jgi:ADP-ribose pyrophosphatase YjhB (NUDIX family)
METPASRFQYCPICAGRLQREIIENSWRLRCRSCGEIHYENPKPSVAVICRNDAGEILLVLRNVEPGKGRWCLPGGFIEMGETVQAAALRELKEETGFDAELLRVVDAQSKLNGYYGDVVVIGFEARIVGGGAMPGDDAAELRFFPADMLPDIAFGSHQRFIEAVLNG